jgi:hypothetical protein
MRYRKNSHAYCWKAELLLRVAHRQDEVPRVNVIKTSLSEKLLFYQEFFWSPKLGFGKETSNISDGCNKSLLSLVFLAAEERLSVRSGHDREGLYPVVSA